jgi:hypothetical protein
MLSLLALIALVGGGWKLFGPKPVPPITFHYWIEGEAIAKRAPLTGRDASFPLSGINVTAHRRGTDRAIVLRPASNALLLDSSQSEKSELAFTNGGRVVVKGASGTLTAMNFDFDKAPPRPEAAKNSDVIDEFTETGVTGTTTSDSEYPAPPPAPGNATSGRKDDEWGLG